MISQEITGAVPKENTGTKKRITPREYVKSVLFIAAIYALILNQAQHEKTDARFFAKETTYRQENIKAEIRNRQIILPSLIYSGISIIFYPTNLLWK